MDTFIYVHNYTDSPPQIYLSNRDSNKTRENMRNSIINHIPLKNNQSISIKMNKLKSPLNGTCDGSGSDDDMREDRECSPSPEFMPMDTMNSMNSITASMGPLKISLPANNPRAPHLVHSGSTVYRASSPKIGSISNNNNNMSQPRPTLSFKQHSLNTRIPIFDSYSCFRMLFDRYILSDSVMSVNIDSECRSQLIEIFTGLEIYYNQINEPKENIIYRNTQIINGWDLNLYITIFDEAATQVWRLLSSDPFIRFTATEEYVEFHSMVYRNKK